MLQDSLNWCIKYTNILTAKDKTLKEFDFIEYAKAKGFIKVLEMLINQGIKVEFDFKQSMNSSISNEGIILCVLGWCCKNTNMLSVKDARSGKGFIHHASEKGYMPIVDCLLKVSSIKKTIFTTSYIIPVEVIDKSLLNFSDHSGSTPLHIASDKGYYELARLLLENGAIVNAHDENLWTPLHKASKNGHFDLTCLLISFKANVNSKTSSEYTPLHVASQRGHLTLARLLIKNGAFVNAQDKNFWSPLNWANKMDI